MTIFKQTVREAAFWGQWVCVACGTVADRSDGSGCPNCDSAAFFSAESVLEVLDSVVEEE